MVAHLAPDPIRVAIDMVDLIKSEDGRCAASPAGLYRNDMRRRFVDPDSSGPNSSLTTFAPGTSRHRTLVSHAVLMVAKDDGISRRECGWRLVNFSNNE